MDGTWRVAVPEPDEDGRDRGAVRGDAPEVVAATLLVTNLYTGSEPTPTTGEEVPPGYVENDDVYWLRYQ